MLNHFNNFVYHKHVILHVAEFSLFQLELHVVPAEVQKLGKRTISNCVVDHDPYVHCSRDAIKIVPQKKYWFTYVAVIYVK